MPLENVLSTNSNLLQPNKFRLVLGNFPNVVYRCTAVELPGITLGRIEQTSPFAVRPIPGDKLIYDDLELTFQVDEDLKNWLEIHNWMRAIGKPKDFRERRKVQPNPLNAQTGQVYSDATVIVLSPKNNPLYSIEYKACWPSRLTPIRWAADTDANEIIVATVTLPYIYYDIVAQKSNM
jgi:hypothetical protein